MMRDLSGIKAKESYSSTPLGRELTVEERRARWQPPKRDASRFSGTSISRHRSSGGYKDDFIYDDDRFDGIGEAAFVTGSRVIFRTAVKPSPAKPYQEAKFALQIMDFTGQRIYQCGNSKSESVLERLKKMLPKGSYSLNGNTVRLCRSLESLGFGSAKEFRQWCSRAKAKRKKSRKKQTTR